MAKILVVEDEKKIADLLNKGLTEFGFDVVLCFDGEMAIRLLKTNVYDLIITDVILPHFNGFEVAKVAKSLHQNTPIIMLTALGNTDDKLDGFDSGADDYMVKPFDLRELNARINLLLNRKKQFNEIAPATVLKYEDIIMNLQTREVQRANEDIKLTPKEFNLLKFMLENPERVLPRSEIAEKVWDTHFDTGTNFIDVYINYLRKKIDKEHSNKLIQTSTGVGFILKSQL